MFSFTLLFVCFFTLCLFVCLFVCSQSDGKCVMSTLSIDHPVCPPVPGITRGQVCWSLVQWAIYTVKSIVIVIVNVIVNVVSVSKILYDYSHFRIEFDSNYLDIHAFHSALLYIDCVVVTYDYPIVSASVTSRYRLGTGGLQR